MTQGMFKLKDNIRRWMACKNPPWTAQRLAKELDYDPSFVSEVFNGFKQPSWQLLRRLADLTGLWDGGELVHYDPDGPTRIEPKRRKAKKGA